ncbi:unnamed protein product [Pieris macdunnoughi]|uniref:Uncharacterized protein n=1 Tax=Pieris macdunnoughi TaxID=345717 RepID=A0A821WD88_9NEOP|nr:unnamed protein product [Pieris macdunnoughi]
MLAKSVLVFCAQALLIQCITAYVYEPCMELPYEAYAYPASGYSPASLAASNCGSFFVSSSSPIAPSGVTMISENAIEGPLAVGGQIPFLAAVAVEGSLPTAGAGGVAYGGGNGNVAILAEDIAGYGRPRAAYAPYY